jgi:hypothetical protein
MKTLKQPKAQSSIIYQGPSLIDGSPIVVIALIQSGNIKTGNMVQTYIIRSDVDPLTASKTGLDFAICGNCVHKGKPTDNPDKKQALERTCYVTLYHGPLQVFKAFTKGNYPVATAEQTQAIGASRMVRLGTYGDPLAVPASVWGNLLLNSAGHTGYTHQHNANSDYSRVMYSADTASEAIQAHAQGKRTFRVIPVKAYTDALSTGHTALLNNEILCPASAEAGYKATCDKCKLCTGSSIKAKSIAIVAHGASKAKVI